MRGLLALVAVAGCAGDAPPERPHATPPEQPGAPLADASARYQLRFKGVPVGYAELSLRRRPGGYQLRRVEILAVERDGVRVDTRTLTTIDADAKLEARRVHLVQRTGSLTRVVSAERDENGWTIARADGATTRTGAGAGVLDLASLRPAPGARPVLVPTAGFARVELFASGSPSRRVLELRTSLGSSVTEITAHADRLPAAWRSDSGESAVRIDGRLVPELEPVPLLSLAAMPGAGRRTSTLRIRGADRPPPPSLASQRVSADGRDWIVRFRRPAVEPPPALADLVRYVADRIEDDLGLPGLGADEALVMGRGDCTGHAAALAALARQRGLEAAVVTGYRRAGRRWLRHRWVAVTIDGEALFVDPSFREARPKPDRLLALTVHGDAADEIALADLVAFSGMASATARFE